MKNIYELSSEDKRQYRKEFNKLKFAKKIYKSMWISLLVFMACIIGSTIVDGILETAGEAWIYFFDIPGILSLMALFILPAYSNISFYRWMRIKHNIQY